MYRYVWRRWKYTSSISYVALVRAYIYVYIRFFHGGISLSIVTKKEKIQHIVIEMSFVRALLRATHFSSAVRCYEPLWSEYWNDRCCWLVWHVYQKHCALCICNCTEKQTFCTSLPAFPSNSTKRETCCKFACISKSTDWGLACILHALAFARVLSCLHFQATVLRDRHVCKSTERQTCA